MEEFCFLQQLILYDVRRQALAPEGLAVRDLRRNISLLAAVASRARKVSSTLLHWLKMSFGWRDGDWSPAAGAQCNTTRSFRPAGAG